VLLESRDSRQLCRHSPELLFLQLVEEGQ
jgi:hypothetical protein